MKLSRIARGTIYALFASLLIGAGPLTATAYATLPVDGSLDSTFGNSGVETTTVGNSGSYISSIAIDSQGRILGGGTSDINSGGKFTLARYTQSGSLDNTFGTAGIATVAGIGSVSSIAIDSQGRVLAGGYSNTGGHYRLTLARFTQSGVLDSNFGSAGVETTTIGSSSSTISSIAIDSQGRVLAGGVSEEVVTSELLLKSIRN